MAKIGVFGSSSTSDKKLLDLAEEVGALLAEKGARFFVVM